MRKDMTPREIALARKWLDIGNENIMPDYSVNAVVNGTLTHARIQLKLAWDDVKTAIRGSLFGRIFK